MMSADQTAGHVQYETDRQTDRQTDSKNEQPSADLTNHFVHTSASDLSSKTNTDK